MKQTTGFFAFFIRAHVKRRRKPTGFTRARIERCYLKGHINTKFKDVVKQTTLYLFAKAQYIKNTDEIQLKDVVRAIIGQVVLVDS